MVSRAGSGGFGGLFGGLLLIAACSGGGGPATGPGSGGASVGSSGGTQGGAGGQNGTGGKNGTGGAPSIRPELVQVQLDLDAAFELPSPGTLDEKLRSQGPLVASGDVPAGHGGTAEPSLLLQFVKRDAVVRAGLSGTVLKVLDQTAETCDSEVHIVPDGQDARNPEWLFSYDHVKNPLVSAGQHVSAGDPLGSPGSLFFGCDGPGRVELQVNHQTTGLAHCPLSFLPAATRATVEASLRELMNRWNTAAGQPVYDQAHLTAAGCMTETSQP